MPWISTPLMQLEDLLMRRFFQELFEKGHAWHHVYGHVDTRPTLEAFRQRSREIRASQVLLDPNRTLYMAGASMIAS